MALSSSELIREQALRFVKSFVSHSKRHRDALGLIQIWADVLENYLVNPYGVSAGDTARPLTVGKDTIRSINRGNPGDNTPILGSETREVVDILTAKLCLALFGGPRDYIRALKRGREDAKAARTVSQLAQYDLSLPGHYHTLVAGIKDVNLFGTGILFGSWCYEPGTVSETAVKRINGIDVIEEVNYQGAIYDDFKLRRIDPTDFFPAVGYDLIQDMPGVAYRFTMTSNEALAYAQRGKYGYDEGQVKLAIAKGDSGKSTRSADTYWRQDRVPSESIFSEYKPLTGLEYWGEVPWNPPDGNKWRVITILGDTVVRDVPWFLPLREIPFYDLRASIIGGRFWGLSPAEAIRYQQDASNVLMMLMLDGTLRAVHPPVVYNRGDEIDRAALRGWRPDAPVASDYPGDIRTLTYGHNYQAGWAMRGNLQDEMKQNSGATGAVAGYGLGVNRASAAEFTGSLAAAMDRPEFMASLIEQESLPRLGRGILRFNQFFLSSTEELTRRIGERPDIVELADIHGDFDIQFVGSRNAKSLQARLLAFDRVLGMSADPKIGSRINWDDVIATFLEDNGYDVAAQELSDPEVMLENIVLQQLNGQQGMNPNQIPPGRRLPAPNQGMSQSMGQAMPPQANMGFEGE